MTLIRAFILVAVFATPTLFSQTKGTATLEFLTRSGQNKYSPKHVLAVWIVAEDGKFIRTLKLAGKRRKKYLKTWKKSSDGNMVDAVTSATLKKHEKQTIEWDCKDSEGNLVPDGIYEIRIEFTDAHVQGPLTPPGHITFTKGPESVEVTPKDLKQLTNIKLSYKPAGE